MLRSSREGRKRAAMYHAFPTSHPAFTSRYTQKVGSVQHGRYSLPSQLQRTSRSLGSKATHHHATIRSSSLRQAAIESDSDSEGSSSPRPACDDVENSIKSTSSCTTHTDAAADEGDTVLLAESDTETETQAKEAEATLHQRKTPSRETTEEQSLSVSLNNSSPPTSHSEGGEDAILDTLKQWHADLEIEQQLGEDVGDHLEGQWYSAPWENDVQAPSTSLSPVVWVEEQGEGEEDNDFEEAESEEESARQTSPEEPIKSPRRLGRILVDGTQDYNDRERRTKRKSLKMKEAEETLALSPKSKRKAEARRLALQEAEQAPTPSPTWSDYLARERRKQGEELEAVLVKRGRGRPRGTNKERAEERARQRAIEKRLSEMSSPIKASTTSAQTVRPRRTTSEHRTSTDGSSSSLALSADSVFGSVDSILRRSSRRSDVAGGSSSAEDVVAKASRPAKLRASPPNPGTAKAAEAPLRSPRVSRAGEVTAKKAGTEQRVPVAGCSIDSGVEDGIEGGTKPAKTVTKRKIYLTSGLYSDDYKKDDTSTVSRRRSAKDVPESLARGTSRTRKAHQVSALPLPVDYGLHLLEQQRDFRLPYSIAQEIDDIRGKLEAKKKPPPYKHISQNQYFSRPRLDGEIMICQCPSGGNCGDSCMNRLTECLCHPKHCPCGDRCTNIYFGKRKAVKTEVQWYGARGFGLKTLEPIKKGGFIDEYRGEVIDFNEAVRRIRDHYKDMGNYYFLMYDAPAGEMLDGGLKGNITRFANHSCDPNCKVQKWLVCGTGEPLENEYQVALFAERDIEAGEELTYDYGWSAFAAKAVSGESNSATPEICHCGAVTCSGFLGVKKSAAPTASAVVSKVLKRAKKAKKTSAVVAPAEASVSNNAVTSILPASRSMPLPAEKTSSATKAFFASLRKDQATSPIRTARSSASPSKMTPSRVSTSGLMGKVLNGLFSPASTLTSLSSLSDDDVSELERSADSTMVSFDSTPLRRRSSLVRAEPLPFKRKRLPPRTSSPVLTAKADPSSSKMQATPSSSKPVNLGSPIPTKGAKAPKKRILLKDRVIRVLVPNDEEEEESEPNLIVEGKRERKMTMRAIEQDHDLYNRRRIRSSSGARGTSADSEAPATKKARRSTEGPSSSPAPRARLMNRATGP